MPSNPTHVLAIDAGTTGVRTRALCHDLTHAAVAYREFPQLYPRPGWVEHDPIEIWDAALATLDEVVTKIGSHTIAALGITN